MKPHYEGKEGIGQGVAVVRIPPTATPAERAKALDDLRILAKANSTKSRVYRTNWANHKRRGRR